MIFIFWTIPCSCGRVVSVVRGAGSRPPRRVYCTCGEEQPMIRSYGGNLLYPPERDWTKKVILK